MSRFNWWFLQCREALFWQQHNSAALRAQYEDFVDMYNMGNEL